MISRGLSGLIKQPDLTEQEIEGGHKIVLVSDVSVVEPLIESYPRERARVFSIGGV
jgi:hypothetical protein